MRISDWSSDVCSSDLRVAAPADNAGRQKATTRSRRFSMALSLSDVLASSDVLEAGERLQQPVGDVRHPAGHEQNTSNHEDRAHCHFHLPHMAPEALRPVEEAGGEAGGQREGQPAAKRVDGDRKSTRLNS